MNNIMISKLITQLGAYGKLIAQLQKDADDARLNRANAESAEDYALSSYWNGVLVQANRALDLISAEVGQL